MCLFVFQFKVPVHNFFFLLDGEIISFCFSRMLLQKFFCLSKGRKYVFSILYLKLGWAPGPEH